MMPQPVPTPVFHMTRIERLPNIIQNGLLPDNEVRRRGLAGVEIGYRHIKDRRAGRTVPCGPGGTLADYVPFYFAPRSPMLYAIQGGLVSAEAARTERIIYAFSTIQQLRASGLDVVLSNRHAELAYAEFREADARQVDDGFIDWPLMREQYWNNTAGDPDRKERRQAECLVHAQVPWAALGGLVTKSEEVAREVRATLASLGDTTAVSVRRDWYF